MILKLNWAHVLRLFISSFCVNLLPGILLPSILTSTSLLPEFWWLIIKRQINSIFYVCIYCYLYLVNHPFMLIQPQVCINFLGGNSRIPLVSCNVTLCLHHIFFVTFSQLMLLCTALGHYYLHSTQRLCISHLYTVWMR